VKNFVKIPYDFFQDPLSSRPTLLRLISFYNESDGRCVHILELTSNLIYVNYFTIKSNLNKFLPIFITINSTIVTHFN